MSGVPALLLAAAPVVAALVVAVASGRRPAPRALVRPVVPAAPPGPLTPAARLGRALRGALGRPADPIADRRVGRVVLAAGAAAVAEPVLGVVVVGVAAVVTRRADHRRRRRREQAIVDELPEVVDLLALGAGAGLTVPLAIDLAGRHGAGPIADALASVSGRCGRGLGVEVTLASLAVDLGPRVTPVASVLRAAAVDGTPLDPALARVAEEARRERRRAAEERARRLPIRLLGPLIGCVLPAFALLTVVPLLAAALGDLSW